MKKLLFIYLGFLLMPCTFAQSIERQVIGIEGNQTKIANINVSYTIGESVIEEKKLPSIFVSQGFQQPNNTFILKGLKDILLVTRNASCINANDGFAKLQGKDVKNYKVVWSSNTIIRTDSISNLSAGIYTVQMLGELDTIIYDFEIKKSTAECLFTVFNTITPNGDGKNDFLYIKGLENYNDNNLSIYNRWGGELFKINGYNNNSNIFEAKTSSGNKISTGTYFYVLKVQVEADLKTLTGWLEIIE